MRTNIIVRSLSVLLFIISLIAGSAFVYAFAHAQEGMGTIPEGTTAEGIDLSGMTPEEARAELADHAQDASTVSVTLQVGEVEYPVSLDSSVSYDVDSVVDAAMAPLEGQTAADRIEHQVKKRLGRAEVEPRDLDVTYTLDLEPVRAEIERIAAETAATPVDATRTFEGDKVVITEGTTGRALDIDLSYQAAADALAFDPETGSYELSSNVTVPLIYEELKPAVTADSFGKAITVNLTSLYLYLYDGDELEKKYRIGAGKPGYETPTGLLEITAKRKNPVWINPSPDGWGKDMPERMGPAANAPLGLRALNLNRPAIRIHGESRLQKIGAHGSHGCINLTNPDVVDLFDRVEVGTPVYVHH